MRTLYKRLIISAILIALTVTTIFAAPKWFFFAVLEIFILIALYEFLVMASKKGIEINIPLGLFFGALLPTSIYFGSESVILVVACLSLLVANFHPRFREQALLSTSVVLFGLVYVAWFFTFLVKIRYLPGGAEWVFFTILLVKGGDAGAYFIGSKYGKRKLVPHISPNKSVEGAIGCFFTTVALALISKTYLPHVGWGHLVAMGCVIGVLSQFGDLVESLMKRDVGVKDSGAIPGLGGFLDVLDSLLLCVPFVYYYITVFQVLGV